MKRENAVELNLLYCRCPNNPQQSMFDLTVAAEGKILENHSDFVPGWHVEKHALEERNYFHDEIECFTKMMELDTSMNEDT
jgi:hypothetical protein